MDSIDRLIQVQEWVHSLTGFEEIINYLENFSYSSLEVYSKLALSLIGRELTNQQIERIAQLAQQKKLHKW